MMMMMRVKAKATSLLFIAKMFSILQVVHLSGF